MKSIDLEIQKITDYFITKAAYHDKYFRKYGSQRDKDLSALYKIAADEIKSGDYIRKKEDLEKFLNDRNCLN
ncbi:MAG TPA: hypothetical protein PLP33_25940 [Leptospiraceae bacterium]|nr:hypothetical protein [Leptospiraceae bacterium]